MKRTGYWIRGWALFIPMKVSKWLMKPKKPLLAVKKYQHENALCMITITV